MGIIGLPNVAPPITSNPEPDMRLGGPNSLIGRILAGNPNAVAKGDTASTVGVADWNRWHDDYNKAAKEAAEEQRIWSAQQAKEQMAFQREMADTVYQRAVADMRKAGLNPALLYTHGGGQSPAPAGAMATSATADVYKQNDPLVLLTSLLSLLGTALTSVGGILGKAL